MKRTHTLALASLTLLAALTAGGCVHAHRGYDDSHYYTAEPPPIVYVDPNVLLHTAVGLGIIAAHIWGRGRHCH